MIDSIGAGALGPSIQSGVILTQSYFVNRYNATVFSPRTTDTPSTEWEAYRHDLHTLYVLVALAVPRT